MAINWKCSFCSEEAFYRLFRKGKEYYYCETHVKGSPFDDATIQVRRSDRIIHNIRTGRKKHNFKS